MDHSVFISGGENNSFKCVGAYAEPTNPNCNWFNTRLACLTYRKGHLHDEANIFHFGMYSTGYACFKNSNGVKLIEGQWFGTDQKDRS